jgi:hypothetical protein
MGRPEQKPRVFVNHRPPTGQGTMVDRYYCSLRAGGVRLSRWYETVEDAEAAAVIITCAVGLKGYWISNGTIAPEYKAV